MNVRALVIIGTGALLGSLTTLDGIAEAKRENACQRAVIKEGSRFFKTRAKALRVCAEGLLRGELGPDPGPGARVQFCLDHPVTGARIEKASARLAAKVGRLCGGENRVCGDGDGEVDVQLDLGLGEFCPNIEGSLDPACSARLEHCGDLVDCMVCQNGRALDRTVGEFLEPVVDTTGPGVNRRIDRCQQALGQYSLRFAAAYEKAIAKCWERSVRTEVPLLCPDLLGLHRTGVRAAHKVAKAEAKQIKKICEACGGRDRCDATVVPIMSLTEIREGSGRDNDLAPAELGSFGSCPDVTVSARPGQPAVSCARPLTTLTDLVSCVDCVTTFRVSCALAARASGEPFPPECNP